MEEAEVLRLEVLLMSFWAFQSLSRLRHWVIQCLSPLRKSVVSESTVGLPTMHCILILPHWHAMFDGPFPGACAGHALPGWLHRLNRCLEGRNRGLVSPGLKLTFEIDYGHGRDCRATLRKDDDDDGDDDDDDSMMMMIAAHDSHNRVTFLDSISESVSPSPVWC